MKIDASGGGIDRDASDHEEKECVGGRGDGERKNQNEN